jgi:ER lumen protein retaining receptor
MNIFRFCGDMLHLGSILLLLSKLLTSKNCVGISARMQEMYLITFVCRYLDLFYLYVSLYNTMMKVTYITLTAYTLYLIRVKMASSYDRSKDYFPYEKYVLPAAGVLAFVTAYDWSVTELLWDFSIWVESCTIVPQLFMIQSQTEIENLTANYVFAMGLYRAFYILNWIFRYFNEGAVNYVGWVGGTIQTGLYCDFFYYYSISKWYGQKLILPMNA